MDKYFVIEIQFDGYSTIQSIFGYPNEDDAIIAYHLSIASLRQSVKDGNLMAASGVLMDYKGTVKEGYSDFVEYIPPAEPEEEPEPEPEPEPEEEEEP